MGTFTPKDRRAYQYICHLREKGVLTFMRDLLRSRYDTVVETNKYVYAIGDIPVALIAHADTVFRMPPEINEFYYDQEKDVIWNPGGAGADDRAGIFAITKIVRTTKFRPHIIITTGEESGCIGATKLAFQERTFPADLKFMIQLDRRGHNDAVYYECDNPEFEDFITQFGFETHWGTLSDISVLAPAYGVAAVNLSVGYEDEHTAGEHLHVDWLYETIEKVIDILAHVVLHGDEVPQFKYIPVAYMHNYYYGMNKWFNRSCWYDYDDNEDYAPEGYEHCFMCNKITPIENMLQIWYPHGKHSYNMCLDCHADLAHQILWCDKCGKAYYLSTDQIGKIPDINNWTCEECKYGNKNDSGTIQQSNSTQSEHSTGSDQHGSDFRGMEEEQKLVLVNEQLSRIRAPGNCML